MHMYNNYYHGSTSTSISIRGYAYAFIEYCYFDGNNNTMIDVQSYDSNTLNSYGVAKIFNCIMNGKGYSYNAMPADEKPLKQDENKANEPFINFVTDRAKKVTNLINSHRISIRILKNFIIILPQRTQMFPI